MNKNVNVIHVTDTKKMATTLLKDGDIIVSNDQIGLLFNNEFLALNNKQTKVKKDDLSLYIKKTELDSYLKKTYPELFKGGKA